MLRGQCSDTGLWRSLEFCTGLFFQIFEKRSISALQCSKNYYSTTKMSMLIMIVKFGFRGMSIKILNPDVPLFWPGGITYHILCIITAILMFDLACLDIINAYSR